MIYNIYRPTIKSMLHLVLTLLKYEQKTCLNITVVEVKIIQCSNAR